MNVEYGFEFEEESDFGGNVYFLDISELFEVKVQVSLMQSLLSFFEISSFRNNQFENSFFSNMSLYSGLFVYIFSLVNQFEVSFMVNFFVCSVRFESSSVFQFFDIIDQLEQFSYSFITVEDSSSIDIDFWGFEVLVFLDVSFFFSNFFVQIVGERVIFDLQNNVKNLILGEQIDKNLF